MRVVAVIQARMGSTRLPGKALSDLAGEPMLARVVNRSRRAKMIDEVVVATTNELRDETIVELCNISSVACFRGCEDDVLDRYHQAAKAHKADVVVRITSDCPLIEPEIIDLVVRPFVDGESFDYVSNTLLPRSYPRGLDVEVIGFEALARAWREDKSPASREHVTPYIYRHPDSFRLSPVVNDRDLSSMRWTVDTSDDLAFVRRIYHNFGHDQFSWRDVLTLLNAHPEWLDINRHVTQKLVM